MASKKTAAKKRSDKRRQNLKELRELTKRARHEVDELLAHAQAGTELRTGLEELEDKLELITVFQHRI